MNNIGPDSSPMSFTGEAKKLQLEADFEGIDLTADGSDAVMLYASVVDENGTVCDTAVNQLKFTVVSGEYYYKLQGCYCMYYLLP